jgi:hypothetical protein
LLSPEGKAISVADGEDGEKLAKTKMVIASPSYMLACGMSHKVKKVGDTIRCICILDKQIPALENNTSAQIIIPQRQTGRKSGIKYAEFKLTFRHLYHGSRHRSRCLLKGILSRYHLNHSRDFKSSRRA